MSDLQVALNKAKPLIDIIVELTDDAFDNKIHSNAWIETPRGSDTVAIAEEGYETLYGPYDE
eukprot:5238329-Prorocentrum_lima.AAC.1